MRLTVGDTVLVYKELDAWYYGCLSPGKEMGIFPKNYVVVRDAAVASTPLHNG